MTGHEVGIGVRMRTRVRSGSVLEGEKGEQSLATGASELGVGAASRAKRCVRAAACACAAALGVGPTHAQASINVELRPTNGTVVVGGVIGLGLFLVSDNTQPQRSAAAQIILNWDPSRLQLLGLSSSGAIPLLSSSFPRPDPNNLNEASPPADGDAMYVALGNFGTGIVATPAGSLLTTIRFQALGPLGPTPVSIPQTGGNPVGRTEVFDGTIPNTDATGTLMGATVTVVPGPGVACVVAAGAAIGFGRRRVMRPPSAVG
jgi:hypothetical protein